MGCRTCGGGGIRKLSQPVRKTVAKAQKTSLRTLKRVNGAVKTVNTSRVVQPVKSVLESAKVQTTYYCPLCGSVLKKVAKNGGAEMLTCINRACGFIRKKK